MFSKEAVEADVTADQRGDVIFISEELLTQILEKTPDAKIVQFDTNEIYRRVKGEACLTCRKTATLDVNLGLTHGFSLLLRNVK